MINKLVSWETKMNFLHRLGDDFMICYDPSPGLLGNNKLEPMLCNRNFQTWLLNGWQHNCQPIRNHVKIFLLNKMGNFFSFSESVYHPLNLQMQCMIYFWWLMTFVSFPCLFELFCQPKLTKIYLCYQIWSNMRETACSADELIIYIYIFAANKHIKFSRFSRFSHDEKNFDK